MSETAPKEGESEVPKEEGTAESEQALKEGEETLSPDVAVEEPAPTSEQEVPNDHEAPAPPAHSFQEDPQVQTGIEDDKIEQTEAPIDAPKDGNPDEVVPDTKGAITDEVVPETSEEAPVTGEVEPDKPEEATDEVVPDTSENAPVSTEMDPDRPEESALTGATTEEVVPTSPTAVVEEKSPTANEDLSADLTLPPVDTEETLGLPSPSVRNMEVPDKEVDITASQTMRPTTAERLAAEKIQARADRLREAVAGAMAGIGDDLDDDPDMSSALSEWKAKLDSHVQELQGIMQQKLSTATDPAPSMQLASPFGGIEEESPEEKAEEILGNVATVRSMRQQLECHRTGRDVEEVGNAWADPEEAEKEVEELRRVRRQIRYLFGGMIGNLPESTSLKIDDLISDHGEETAPLTSAVPHPPPMRPTGIPQSPRNVGPFAAAVSGMPEAGRIKGVNAATMESPRLPPAVPQQVRPRSGGTESIGSVTNSSVATWKSGGAEDEERRRDRKDRKHHRSRGREHKSVEPPREHRSIEPPRESQKKDDGTIPSKQWNWAEEVVKASLDPGNQWEFPSANDGRMVGTPPRIPRRGQPSWEQPRQVPRGAPGPRGQDIAVKARERAEEVMRSEKERHRNYPSDMVEASSYAYR